MKQLLLRLYIFLALLSSSVYAQNIFNKGGTSQKQYFTTIPYKEVKTKVIIQCHINGKPYNFIVDTGAITAISPALHKELNLPVISHVPIRDINEKVDSLQMVSLKNIQLGNVTFNDIPTLLIKDSLLFDCFKVDGLIGSNLLRNSIVQFASQTHTLTITDKAGILNLKRKDASKMLTSERQSDPIIVIEVINDKLHFTEELLFDSGANSFYDFSYKSFKELLANQNLLKVEAQAVGAYSIGLYGVSNEQENYRIFVPELKINSYTFKNVTAATSHGGSLIGAQLFKYGTVTLDYINKKFYFEPYEKEPANLTEKSWPFIPTAKDGKFVIGLVWDKIWEGKINPDDIILSFDGMNYENTDVCEALITDHTSKSSKATLVLKDPKTGALKEFEVTR